MQQIKTCHSISERTSPKWICLRFEQLRKLLFSILTSAFDF